MYDKISFQGLKYDKVVSKRYRDAIDANPEISRLAANKYNIKVSVRDVFSKADKDFWHILKFRIKEKGLIRGMVDYYYTIVSSKVFGKEIFAGIKKMKLSDFDKVVKNR